MAIIRGHEYLWPYPVPYEPIENSTVNAAIKLINDAVRFDVFVPRQGQEHYVKFQTDGSRDCSDIGCQSKGEQSIFLKVKASATAESATEKARFACVHEMMHCLGFEHEQFHPDYAWDRTDLGKKNDNWQADPVGTEKMIRKLPATSTARALGLDATTKKLSPLKANTSGENQDELTFTIKRNEAIYKHLLLTENAVYAKSFIAQLTLKMTQNLVPATPRCDYNSVMMYSAFRAAAARARKLDPDNIVFTESPHLPPEKILTASDVQALRELYGRKWNKTYPTQM